MTPTEPLIDRLTGLAVLATLTSFILANWIGGAILTHLEALCALALIALLTGRVHWTRWIFVLVGGLLVLAEIATDGGWFGALGTALGKAAFIAAFFAALTTLRHAADTSPAIGAAGRFLASQPPGRRYGALTLGGQVFGLLLNYGAITLLGSLARASTEREPDPEIRGHRRRRMLLAIQRGFVSTLTWSPLAFAMAISTSLVPGAEWSAAVAPCFAAGMMLAGLGWALDTIFKPRLSAPLPPRRGSDGHWTLLLPLLALLLLLVTLVAGLGEITGLPAVPVVVVVVPLISAAWVALQAAPGHRRAAVASRARRYFTFDVTRYRGELVILMMAGFIGSIGSALLVPLIAASGIDLARLPATAILVALIWIIPLAGQLGMNPILAVSLIAPALPAPAAMGVPPWAVIVALTGGWALSGASSPFTATTLMVGSLGDVSANHVGLRWNGAYTLTGAILLSLWVALLIALA